MAATDSTAAWNAALDNLRVAVQQCVEAGKDVVADVKSEILQAVEDKIDEVQAAEGDEETDEAE